MKINFINESDTKFRFYIVCNAKKIYKKNVNVSNIDKCEIHFDEQKNMNSILLMFSRFLFGLACWNANDDEANQVINKDVFVAKVSPTENIKEITFILSKDYHLSCNKNVTIIENIRENDNPKISSWRAVILLTLGFLFLIALMVICFYIAGGPF